MNVRNNFKKGIAAVMSAAIVLGMMPGLSGNMTQVQAADGVAANYVDENGDTKTVSNVTMVTTDTVTWGTSDSPTWYVVSGEVNISSRVTVNGDVNIILSDGASLNAAMGITVVDNDEDYDNGSANRLTIYGQSKGTGGLVATGKKDGVAGIGGTDQNANCGEIVINGGIIEASSCGYAAGIGGGVSGSGGNITINGGMVTATTTASAFDPAGIGGGNARDANHGSAGNITITGGTVIATGSCKGIGAGGESTNGKIVISGGKITANGIGNGAYDSGKMVSTDIKNNAIIFCNGNISTTNKDNWSGVIFQNNNGTVYGKPTLEETLEITENQTLTIPANTTLSIPADTVMTIAEGAQLINNGLISGMGKIVNDGMISGDGTASVTVEVDKVGNITAKIDAPVAGKALANPTKITSELGDIVELVEFTWMDGDNTVTGNAGYATAYTANCTLKVKDGYSFKNGTIATVNDNAAKVTKNDDGTLTVAYTFPATAKDKLIKVIQPADMIFENGTDADTIISKLPREVGIKTEADTVTTARVYFWDETPLYGDSYDSSVLTEQTLTLTGYINCADSVDLGEYSGNLYFDMIPTTITIKVSAAGITGAPTANPTAGTYTENQSVTLTSSTEGATIYYTTDGSEPTLTGGVPGGTTKEYTAPIAVTGTEGQSITTVIKAMAVKSGMQDSSVETFTYSIQLPVSKYDVTVINGSGSGHYAQGETVTITASAAPSGQQFKEWEIVSGNITLASSTSETTSFIMQAEAVSVKAIYEAVPVTEYTITATAGANGTISPSGAVKVTAGSSQTFTISPSSGYVIDTLKVDGLEVTAATSYTFSDVSANHTIEVTFKQESQTPEVTAPSITTQPGNATVKAGETATFTIAASGTDLTYQWQIDRNDGNGWVNIAGATATGYTTSTVDISCNGFKYQCVVSNSAGTVTSNAALLTVTENTTSDPDPVDYDILDGANSSWTQNSDGSLSIRGSGAFSKFVGLKVDGTLVDVKNYSVKEGSTIVTLKTGYLNTLSVGTHTFEILWTDGSASTTFTVVKNTSDSKDNDTPAQTTDAKKDNQNVTAPKTGDDTPVVWMFILFILSGTGLIITAKKRRINLDSSER